MLSIEECSRLIDDQEKYTDKEIEEIRDDFQILAELAWEKYIEEKRSEKPLLGH